MNRHFNLDRFCALRRAALIAVSAGLLAVPVSSQAAAPHAAVPARPAPAAPSAGPVDALIYSTMPSMEAHRPEMAMDGDAQTYFQSQYGMDEGDDFWVILSRAIPASSLRVVTGDADGQDTLTNAVVETSPDAVHYLPAASFDSSGVAAASGPRMVRALRIRLKSRQGVPRLIVREISVSGPTKIAHAMMGAGRGFVNISQAPDLAVWAATAEKQMEESWPDTDALLYSSKFIPPNAVNVVYRTGAGVTDVAATGGGVMTVNSAWCRAHPDDTGLTVHETAHVIQAFSAYNPVWLVEGIADYIRWVKFEPQNFHPRINVQKATYHDAYQTTATFLGWCELHYDSRLVTKFNQDDRFGNFKVSLFKDYCGKDVDTLWAEFLADYQKDPAAILAPQVAAADKPRVLPPVAPGSGVSADLSGAFNTVGITTDAKNFDATSGLDGGGTAYSAALLGRRVTWQGVPFQIGPPDAPDVVSCNGQTAALPAGQYAALWMLGTAINGSQNDQQITVTYTDGTTTSFAQNFSDWYQTGRFAGETSAVKMAYRNTADAAQDARTFYAYSYGFPLDPAKTVKSLLLPDNDSIKLLAVTVTK